MSARSQQRSSYYWLCNALDIYCPVQWEYSRLNMENTVLSKRKILKLIETGVVSDWDDPRLFTLTALRRRGIPPEAINNFVAKLGLTVAQATIRPLLLDAVVRDYLNVNAPRTMAVLQPLKIEIVNFAELECPAFIDVANFPPEISTPSTNSSHSIALDNVVYIEKTDFEEEGSKGFRRLTKKQCVGLKHVGLVLEFISLKKNEGGEVREICVKAAKAASANAKPKAFIHWVAKPESCEVRSFDQPENSVEDGNEEVCIPPMKIYSNAFIDHYLREGHSRGYYQFERTGFYGIDPKDSTAQKVVFNQIVALKDTTKKN